MNDIQRNDDGGVLAAAAMELRKAGGSLIASRMGQRNLELVRNLGLHRKVGIATMLVGLGVISMLAYAISPGALENLVFFPPFVRDGESLSMTVSRT